MAQIKIAVFSRASESIVSATDVQQMVDAIQAQVHEDFAPVWGVDADITFYRKSKDVPAGSWVVGVFENADQAGALGYHDLTQDGLPLGKVFAKTTLDDGGKISVTMSHEILEMLGDPDINLTAFVESGNGGRLYAYEVCDAVEADGFGYEKKGVVVSDFVTPAWFESFRTPGSTAFSFREHVRAPFELAEGGYIGIYDVGSGSGWQQLLPQAAAARYQMRPHLGSRRERRRTLRSNWLRSRPE